MISKNEMNIMIFAFRYAVGRKTYAPMTVREYVETKIPQMTKAQVRDLMHEIEREELIDEESMKLLKALWKAAETKGDGGESQWGKRQE